MTRDSPLSWRLRKEQAGSGALGDIGAHIVDLTQFITGEQLTGVSALMETFVRERPVSDPTTSARAASVAPRDERLAATAGHRRRRGSVLSRIDGGALATFEATRFATGRKNAIRLEINGTHGRLAFDFEDMNVLHVHDERRPPPMPASRRVLVTEGAHPYVASWWPPGHVLGYEHAFTHQAVDLVTAIAEGTDPRPSFADGLQVQQVLSAVETSAEREGSWTPIVGARATSSATS